MGHLAVLQLSAAALPAIAFAHQDAGAASSSFEPWLIAVLAISAIGYARGVHALWLKAGIGRGVRSIDAILFATGWVTLVAALLSPIDALAERSFAVHMIQHELLMVVAAPLLVLSRPLEAWAWALPHRSRRALASVFAAAPIRRGWRWVSAPASAWCCHALALWTWHVPALFLAALANEGLHVLQHSCFFASALLFWWAAIGRQLRAPNATSIALLFTTMLHTSALGLLLTFAPMPWYAHYELGALGLSALEDQQLGGLVMWVPGSLAYLVAGLGIIAAWLSPSRAEQRPG